MQIIITIMQDIFDIFEDLLSDDEEHLMMVIERPRQPKIIRERANHFGQWSDAEFLNRFRLSKQTTMVILNQISETIAFPTNRNNCFTPLHQLLITLRFFASGCMLIVVGDFGGIHKTTASRIIRRVSTAIAALSAEYIHLPRTEEEIGQTKEDFYTIARFPRVIGAIDCTHIKIQSPGGDDAEHYRNRKGYFSINVQTVADPFLRIVNIVARWPGAAHDSTIFNNSRLRADMETIYNNCFLVGDAGYPVRPFLMTPLQQVTTGAEQLYNESQIRTRNVVERSYGVWKRKFPILSLGIRLQLPTTLTVIVATAVLHNMAINNNDGVPDGEIQNEAQENELANIQGDGQHVRRTLIETYFSNL